MKGFLVYIDYMSSLINKIKLLLKDIHSTLAHIKKEPVLAAHEIRKRTKYIRALLAINPELTVDLKTLMRSISDILAPYRDAQVNWDTYQIIISADDSLIDQSIHDKLQQNPFFIEQGPKTLEIEKIHGLIEAFSAHLKTIPANDSDQIIEQIKLSHLSGKKALGRVKKDSRSQIVHRWRKETKRLWYQLRFIFGDLHDDPNHPLSLSQTLGQLLGEIHDLDVLVAVVPIPQNSSSDHI